LTITSMLGFIPRLRRKVDRNSWIPIGEGSQVTTNSPFDSATSARVDGPPNFSDPNPPQLASSPPPSYAQIRNIARPEVAALLPGNRTSFGTPGSPTNATPRASLQPVVSSNVTSLEDIRHGEVVNHIHMDNRLTSVPNYPVFLEAPPASSRRRQSRRPVSIASTSTAGLFLAVGQLPGSEPFDLGTTHTASNRDGWRRSQGMGSPLSPAARSEPETAVAHVVTMQRVPTTRHNSTRPPQEANRTSCLLSDSTQNLARERWNPPTEGFYAPGDGPNTAVKSVRTWPLRQQSTNTCRRSNEVHVRFSNIGLRDPDIPPPPPPKDPGYVSRPRSEARLGGGALRKCHSSPNLLRFAGLHRKSHDYMRSEWRGRNIIGDKKSAGIADSSRMSAGTRFSNRRSQFLDACARFLSRSVPRHTRVAVSS